MGGRVKYKPSVKPGKISPTRNLVARHAPPPAATTSDGSVFQIPSSSGPMLDKSSIIWISVLSAFALGCFIFALWMVLRGRCCRRRKNKKQANGHRYHPSLQMKDGRNEFEAWNKSEGRVDSAMSVLPPTSTAVQPAGFAHPGNPVIVDEIPPQPVPMYGRNNKERYYSGLSNSLKRFSSIGKAY